MAGRLTVMLVLLAAGSAAALSQTQRPETSMPRVLYLTHSAGYRHQVLPLSQDILKEIGARDGRFDVTATTECCGMITADGLRAFDAIVFYTTGELPMDEGQKRALLEFVRGGKGFAGIHSATDTFYKWPEYGELVGGYFDGHPWHETVRVRVEDAKHPATSHLQDGFELKDEIYQFRNWSRDRVHVLLSLDAASIDLTKKGVNRTDRDFGLSWTRRYGQGRVFYTALGHEADVWRDRRFQEHLAGGILWAVGRR